MAELDLTRVRGNVQKMLGQNAPEAEIDAYLTSEGLTAEKLRAGKPAPSIPADMAKSLGSGLAEGGIGVVGLPGDALELAGKLQSKPQAPPSAVSKDALSIPSEGPAIPGSRQIKEYVEGRFGKLHEPETVPGEYMRTMGQMAPGALLPGGLARRAANVVLPALSSETAGQLTKGSPSEPYARVAGALMGVPSIGGRGVTPLPASAERQRLVNILNDEGVTSLTAGQRTGRPALRYAESVLGDYPGAGSQSSRMQQEGQRQFTEAAVRRAGAGPDASPETLAANNTRLGDEFQNLSARNTLQFDVQFANDAGRAIRNYERVPPSQQRAIVENYVNDIADHMTRGGMPGREYQEMRSRLSRQANGLRESDPTLSEALRDLRNALDNGMRRSISPADREAWDTARREYGAQKVLEKAASRAGEATAEGQIVPANLRNAVSAENRGAYARGEGQFSELARAGSGIMAPLPQSGAAPRALVTGLTTGLGGGLGVLAGGAPEATMAMAGGAALPAVMGRALMSRPVQGYLGNQLLSPVLEGSNARRDAIVQLLMAEPRLQLSGPRQ